jgi:hypothetical protein
VRETLDQLGSARANDAMAVAFRLFRNSDNAGGLLLDQHDGIPADLILTEQEYQRLQECLERRGLAKDLYFPASALREVKEPRERFGDVAVETVQYSPRQWTDRLTRDNVQLVPPSQEQRNLKFIQACSAFTRAIVAREAELREATDTRTTEDLRQLSLLLLHVTLVRSQVLNAPEQDLIPLRQRLLERIIRLYGPGDHH